MCLITLSETDAVLKRYDKEQPENELGVFMKLRSDYTPLLRELLVRLKLDDDAVVWKSPELPFSSR